MDKQLVKALKNYLAKPKVEGAFYVDGAWGSGKTFFIRTFVEQYNSEHPSKNKSCLYISLNGMKEVGEINTALYSLCHPKLSKLSSSKLLQGLLIAGKSVGNAFGIGSENVDALKDLVSSFTKNICSVLVLDDFERCRIELQELFGYLSSLLTESQIKIILIGNELEVKKYLQEEKAFQDKLLAANISSNADQFWENLAKISEPHIYDSIKEKCIYRTYYFKFDENIFFKELLRNCPKSVGSLVRKNRAAISRILSENKCNNLRTCQTALENYQSIILHVCKEFRRDTDVKTAILLSSFMYTVLEKNGQAEDYFSEKKYYDNVCIYPIEGVRKYVYRSVWNSEYIRKELVALRDELLAKKSEELPEALRRLSDSWYLKTDDQLVSEIHDLKNALGRIPFRYYFKTISCFYLYKSWFRSDNEIDLEKIMNSLICKIQESEEEIDIDDFVVRLDYSEPLKPYFDRLMKEINARNLSLGNDARFSMKSEDLKRYTIEDFQRIENDSFQNKCFFSRINLEQLMFTLQNGDCADIFNIRSFLQNVYRVSNIRDFFQEDLPQLQAFEKQLSQIKSPSIIKTKALELLHNEVKDYIDKLTQK